MTRDLTAGMVAEVTASTLEPILILKAEFDTGDLNLWSGIGSLTFDGDVYTGAGGLLNLTEIKETDDVESNGTIFTLNGIPSEFISTALSSDYQNREITCWFATLDASGALIADPFQLYKGRMDILDISEGGETASLSMKTENRLIELQRAKTRRYTHEDQKAFFPTDKS
jgi:hypothetical protein